MNPSHSNPRNPRFPNPMKVVFENENGFITDFGVTLILHTAAGGEAIPRYGVWKGGEVALATNSLMLARRALDAKSSAC